MIHVLSTIAFETFTLLRRDRIFVPALIIGLLTAAFANLASDWSVEDFRKILFDVGAFGFHFTGCLVAIFWGTKTIHDSRQEGSLEVQLAAPVSRTLWILGKFLGLVLCLVVLAVAMIVFWQGFMLLNQFGWMTPEQVSIFAYLALEWIIAAALAMMFAAFCGQGVALFSSLSLWVAGLSTEMVHQNLAEETPAYVRGVVGFLARIWDLGQFNMVEFATGDTFPTSAELLWRLGYAAAIVALLVTLAAIAFRGRDLTA